MICIMSNCYDVTTTNVLRWLDYYGADYYRIDGELSYSLEWTKYSEEGVRLCLRNKAGVLLKTADVKSFWYRRGLLNINPANNTVKYPGEIAKDIKEYCFQEAKAIEDLFYYLMQHQTKSLCAFSLRFVNKLIVLQKAIEAGLKVPNTLITTKGSDIAEFFSYTQIVTKAIYESFRCDIEKRKYFTYTENVEKDSLNESFFPSLFQEQIEKEADIRTR